MTVSEVQITNILGTKHVSFSPGVLTLFQGKNGSGKTSVIDALRRIFDGGSDPGLLRRGAKMGEVILTLSDGRKIKTRVTAKSTSYEIENPDGTLMKAPREFIGQLADSLSTSPEKILLAKPKDLVAILLEVMPIKFGQGELQSATGEDCWPIARDMSLDEVEILRKQIYEARRISNKASIDAETTIRSLSTSLPEGDSETDWADRTKELRELLDTAKQDREVRIRSVERNEIESIEKLKTTLQAAVDRLKAEYTEAVSILQAENKLITSAIDTEAAPELERLNTALGEAQSRMQDHDRAEGIRMSIHQFKKQKASAEKEAYGFSSAINNLDELKAGKLAGLPISGLEVRDGQVFYEGIAFEHVNLRTRIEIAFQVCALRSTGKLNFMLIDQAEAFDPASWAEFKQGVINSGFQVVAARVGPGELTIEIDNEAAA